jgi:hypothetical protein
MRRAIIDAIGPRLAEPSTWLGLFTVAATLTHHVMPDSYAGPLADALAGLAGVVLVYLRERT